MKPGGYRTSRTAGNTRLLFQNNQLPVSCRPPRGPAYSGSLVLGDLQSQDVAIKREGPADVAHPKPYPANAGVYRQARSGPGFESKRGRIHGLKPPHYILRFY